MRAGSALRQRMTWLLDGVRTRLWPVPVIAVVSAAAVGVALPWLDVTLDGRLPGSVSDHLFGGGPGSAREVLSAIAASLITVTSLTFSLTLVTLQLASGQFSPRLLRTFARDRFVQRTLALFLATFVYALTVLRSVRDGSSGPPFVPQIAVTVAYGLALVSVVGLVLFLAHLVRQIRVETILDTVRADAGATMQALFGEDEDTGAAPQVRLPEPPPTAVGVDAPATGFLLSLDERALVEAAAGAGATVLVDRMPGDWVVAGTPVALVWPADGQSWDDDTLESLRRQIADAVRTGPERTQVQDVAYPLRQLTDVAVKALSPGINDPTTAVHTLGHQSAILCDLTRRRLGPTEHRDDAGVVRAIVQRPDLGDLLDLVVAQPRRYGAADPAVLSGLLVLLREVGWRSALPEHRRAVAGQLARVRRTAAGQDFDDTERAGLERRALAVDAALDGRWWMPPR